MRTPRKSTATRKYNRRKPLKTFEERIDGKYITDPTTGCMLWTGAALRTGYGLLATSHGQYDYVHRIAYENEYGPIPDGQHIHHLCGNRNCINASHLELVGSIAEHMNKHMVERYGWMLDTVLDMRLETKDLLRQIVNNGKSLVDIQRETGIPKETSSSRLRAARRKALANDTRRIP